MNPTTHTQKATAVTWFCECCCVVSLTKTGFDGFDIGLIRSFHHPTKKCLADIHICIPLSFLAHGKLGYGEPPMHLVLGCFAVRGHEGSAAKLKPEFVP